MAALSSDLPALRPHELAAALAAAEAAPRCFVADAHGTGTTLLTAVGTALRPRSDRDRRRRTAPAARVELTGDWPGLVRDVDTEADLRAAVRLGVGPAHVRRSLFTFLRHDERVPTSTASRTPALPADRFLNRELSWLDFNARVLELAEDDSLPLLERVKFLAIFASNLDEFYMVRFAGLKRRQSTGLTVRSPDGLTIREQLELITDPHPGPRAAARGGVPQGHRAAAGGQGHPDRALGGARRRTTAGGSRSTSATRSSRCSPRWRSDPAHPFPYISGLSLNLAVMVRDPAGGQSHFARVKVPNNVPRFIPVGPTDATATFLPLEDLIAAHLTQLFPGLDVALPPPVPGHPQRRPRGGGGPGRGPAAGPGAGAGPPPVRPRRPARGHRVDGPADPRGAAVGAGDEPARRAARAGAARPRLAVGALRPRPARSSRTTRSCRPRTRGCRRARPPRASSPRSARATCCVHHPYHSFATSVQRFIEQAAADPQVLAIKQTLYRTSGDSPIVNALIEAAEAGKQVVVLVEIKARFDEEANITWARSLERAGCHVVYGLVGPEDALQDGARGAPRARRPAAVLPHRHRQLQPEDRAHLRGPRHPHRRPAGGRRPHRPVQHPDRVLAADQLPHAHGRPARHPHRADREDPPRGPARRRGPAVPASG